MNSFCHFDPLRVRNKISVEKTVFTLVLNQVLLSNVVVAGVQYSIVLSFVFCQIQSSTFCCVVIYILYALFLSGGVFFFFRGKLMANTLAIQINLV